MKKLFGFLALAFVFLFTTTVTATTLVQHSLDKKVFTTVASANVNCNVLIIAPVFAGFDCSYRYESPGSILTKVETVIDKKVAIPETPFVLDKDVVWLTNLKSK